MVDLKDVSADCATHADESGEKELRRFVNFLSDYLYSLAGRCENALERNE